MERYGPEDFYDHNRDRDPDADEIREIDLDALLSDPPVPPSEDRLTSYQKYRVAKGLPPVPSEVENEAASLVHRAYTDSLPKWKTRVLNGSFDFNPRLLTAEWACTLIFWDGPDKGACLRHFPVTRVEWSDEVDNNGDRVLDKIFVRYDEAFGYGPGGYQGDPDDPEEFEVLHEDRPVVSVLWKPAECDRYEATMFATDDLADWLDREMNSPEAAKKYRFDAAGYLSTTFV